jgi:hypothetical protein
MKYRIVFFHLESLFFNLYFTRLAPIPACRWKVIEINPSATISASSQSALASLLYRVTMKDSVLSITAANTDNKVNKLVTVFALALLRLPGRRTGDKSGPRNCPLNSFIYHDN